MPSAGKVIAISDYSSQGHIIRKSFNFTACSIAINSLELPHHKIINY